MSMEGNGPRGPADAQPAGRELALLRAARDLFMSNRITPEQIEAVRVAVNAYAEPLRTSDAPHVTISAAEYDEVRLTLARQATELHDLRGRNDAQRYTRDEVIAWSKEGAEDVPEDGRLAGRPDAPREESRLDELLTEVADLVRYWKAYGDDDPGVLSRVADVARAFKDLPPSSRDKAKTSGNEQSPLAPVSGGAEDPSRIMSGSNAGRDGVAAGETAPDNPLAGVRVRRRPETASGSALGDHDRAVALIVEHKIPWCRARLMHVLAACEEQGTVLEEVLEELLPEENGGRGDHDNYENGEQIAGAIEAALRRTGWLGGERATTGQSTQESTSSGAALSSPDDRPVLGGSGSSEPAEPVVAGAYQGPRIISIGDAIKADDERERQRRGRPQTMSHDQKAPTGDEGVEVEPDGEDMAGLKAASVDPSGSAGLPGSSNACDPGHRPPFNHTRGDGPFDPCPTCLVLMSREDLIALVRDLTERRKA